MLTEPFKSTHMTIQQEIKSIISIACTLLLVFTATSQSISPNADLIEEIRKVEKQFESDLNKMGADFAFAKYAALNAVVKRQNDSLIFGPKAIQHYYSNEFYKSAKAFWTPDFIDVSQDGTMAYTYGKYRWITTDKLGKTTEYTGVFHTVWKRQTDGSWKYVWD